MIERIGEHARKAVAFCLLVVALPPLVFGAALFIAATEISDGFEWARKMAGK